jgi:conjugative transfer signal peptidase TraF
MTFRPRSAVAIMLNLAALSALVGVAVLGGLRVNLTPSYPLGLWHVQALERDVAVGDRIFVCPPQTPLFEGARQRGYLGSGLCPGWFSPLIKTVVAVAGQHVAIDGWIAVDGVVIAHSLVLASDGKGSALTPASSGVVPAGHIFLFSDFAGSYDSRYFGPIPVAGVLGLAHPIVVFNR